MKICYVSKGISLHDQKVLRYLVQKHEVHLVSYYGGVLPRIEGLIVHQVRIPNPALAFPIACVLTRLLIRRIKPDIVQGNYLLTYGFYSAVANYHPLLQVAWGSDVFMAPNTNPLYRHIVKYSLKQADIVNVDCLALKRAVIGLGCPEEKIRVFLPFGIDPEKFGLDIDGESVRSELGWTENDIVVCTRNHAPVYGIEYLVKAIPEVVNKHPEARFLLIGSGPLTGKFKQMVRKLNIDKYVIFTGVIPNEILGKYLAASDIFVSPSLSDGPCLSLLEAMLCGLPPLVAENEGVLESVQNGVSGLVVPQKDSTSLAQRICQLIEDKPLRQLFGHRSHEIAKKKALFNDGMNNLEDTYCLLIEQCK